jgi:tetratricopeptide (TPR) repeat protein
MTRSLARMMTVAVWPLFLGVAGTPATAPAAPPAAKPAAAPAPDGEDAPDAERHRGIEWHGASGFFSLGKMTVVYPAGPGEPVDVNRRSAEARARWLTAVHNCKVAVAADDKVTEEQRKGNLLVLGWNNRIFKASGPARPFTHDETGTSFLGLRAQDPRVDLLVFHRNPQNWSAFLLFWSRIDPERDRFQVLPRVGSDWAMYRDYHTIRQGMFVPARVWPPSRDTQAEADHTSEIFVRPGGTASVDSEHFHVVFDRTALKDVEVSEIVEVREAAYAKAAAAVGAKPAGSRILLFLYADEPAKQEATGVGDPTHAIPLAREIHMTRRFALAPSPREELHVLAHDLYGPCYLTAIYDGFALSFGTALQGQDVETSAAILRSTGHLPDPAVLLDEERFRKLPAEGAAASAGAFMAFVRQTYGATGLKKMFGLVDGRTAALAAALDVSEAVLKSSYATWADGLVKSRKSEIDFLAANAEAQKRHETNDWGGMVSALQRAIKAKPGDPQTLFNLASAQMRADDLPGAEASLKTMLSGPLAPADSRFRIFGHYQLGRVYDLAGRRAEALAEYDAVLKLPDDHDAHALAKERKTSPATRAQLE